MRKAIFSLLLSTTLVPVLYAAPAPRLGKVIYTKVLENTQDSPSDVFEKDLDTGKTTTLVDHKKLPKSFKTRITGVIPSPDGRYMILQESLGAIIRDKKSRKIKARVYDSGQAYSPDDETMEMFGSNLWCWDRKAGKTTLLPGTSSMDYVEWTRDSRYAIVSDGDTGEKHRVYDRAARKFVGSRKVPYTDRAAEAKKSLKWPREISDAALSPDARYTVLMDDQAFYLVGPDKKQIKKLPITREEDGFDASFLFSKAGRKLVIQTSYSYGEPHIGFRQEMWIIDVKTGTARQLEESNDYFGIHGESLSIDSVAGWLPDEKTLVLAGEGVPSVSYDLGYMSGHSCSLWTYDTSLEKPKYNSVFDSGDRCINMVWIDPQDGTRP